MSEEKMTFNDLPLVVSTLLYKVERVEDMIQRLNDKLSKNLLAPQDNHIPMTLDEACEFIRMKKSTMYYKLEKGEIPSTRAGKNYILFKDELIKWAESGRRTHVPLSFEEENEARLKANKRKPNSLK